MGGSIYYQSHEKAELVEMNEHAFALEDDFQALLEDHDKLLAGEQIDPEHPRRWLFVAREAGVPDHEDGRDRWSLDHLFLDQDGVPTLVEVKRSTDTRVRREVAGQMLDYAANAIVYWPIEVIIDRFESSCEVRGTDPDTTLGDFLNGEVEPEEFWEQVRTNLKAGKVRMLFVADKIPPELRRIIEFMNEQMDPAEVLGVEVKQYANGAQRAFVSRVIGQTAEATIKKTSTRGEPWTEERFIQALRSQASEEEVAVAIDLIRFGSAGPLKQPHWGAGKIEGNFTSRLVIGGKTIRLFSINTYGQATVAFGWNVEKLGGDDLSEKYRALTNESLAQAFERDKWENGWPRFPLRELVPDGAARLKELVDEYVAEVTRLVETS